MTRLVGICVPFIFAGHLAAQAAASPFIPPRIEIGGFGGGTRFWVNQDAPNKAGWVDGGLYGGRITANLASYLGLEFSGSYGTNNMRVPLSNALPTPRVTFGSRNYRAWVGPILYFVGPHHRFRPYFKAGPAGYWWVPTDQAKQNYNSAPYYLVPHMSMEPAAVAGFGLKGYFSSRVGVRFDADGMYSKQPHYKLPGGPSATGAAYIPYGGGLYGLQLTAGIFIGFGKLEHPAPPAPPAPPPPPPPPPTPTLDVTSADARTIDAGCPGDPAQPVELSVTARTNLPGHSPSYRWTVDGTPVGENSPTFTYTPPQQSGRHVVAVTVTDNPGTSQDTRFAAPVTRELLTATVRDLQPPTISGSANPSTLVRGAASSLTVTPQGGTCGGQVTYTCRADEGTLSGTPPSRFDSTNVAFDMADRSREQSKTVNIVCTATDAKGGTANATLPVVVTLPAELTSRRFDDVVFPAGNSRVNNCGKRILLEEVVTQLNDHPDWDLVVVGHTAPGERAPSRNAALDRERALNVIATLTAGTDTCAKIDLSRVKVALVGAESKSEPRPAFCGTSTRLAAVERPGQATAVNTANAARRVEIYLVPRGGKLPDAADNYEVVPASMLGARGCPK